MADVNSFQLADRLQIVRGVPFPGQFSRKNLEDIMDYVPQDEDIVQISYPKTGTTWLQYIVLQIMSKGELFPSMDDITFKHVPFLEMAGIQAIEAQQKPRIYKHHFAYNMVQKNSKAKILYIYRKPEDTFVSFYHFQKQFPQEPVEFNQLFEDFLSGNIAYGRYFEHILSFLAHKDDENLLLISYEKLRSNKKEEILRIAKFLGEEYYEELAGSEMLLEQVIERTSFENMKKSLKLTNPFKGHPNAPANINFFRKGIIGDGRQSLSVDQLRRLRQVAAEIMKGTEIIQEWLE